ncbi:2495_t:CDS:2, partial [Entrophospora sp. SA101]
MIIKPHDNNKQLKLQQLLMEWIIFDNQSLNILKSDSFKTFINSLDPAFSIPDVKFIKQLIHKSYNHTLPLIIKHIEENALSVSLTIDMWTGHNRLGFLGVTCSYLDENFKMHEQVLAVDYVRYPHTANHISDTLLAILDEWGVRDLTHIITTDNGSNIKKAIKDMEIYQKPPIILFNKLKHVLKITSNQIPYLILRHFNLEELDDVFNDEFIEEIEDAEQNDFNLNQPMHTEGILGLTNRVLYNAMNFYWNFENKEYMIAVMLDPRTKQLTFIREQNIKDDYKLNLQLKYNQISAQQSTITNISSTNVNRDCTLVETETPTLFSIFNMSHQNPFSDEI